MFILNIFVLILIFELFHRFLWLFMLLFMIFWVRLMFLLVHNNSKSRAGIDFPEITMFFRTGIDTDYSWFLKRVYLIFYLPILMIDLWRFAYLAMAHWTRNYWSCGWAFIDGRLLIVSLESNIILGSCFCFFRCTATHLLNLSLYALINSRRNVKL